MFDVKIFKERLRRAREAIGLNQEDFAKKANIARASASYYENPKNTSLPNVETLYNMAKVLGVSYDYLMGMSENKNRENIDIGDKLGLSDELIEWLSAKKWAIGQHDTFAYQYQRQFQVLERLLLKGCFNKIIDFTNTPIAEPGTFVSCEIRRGDSSAYMKAINDSYFNKDCKPYEVAPAIQHWTVPDDLMDEILLKQIGEALKKIREEVNALSTEIGGSKETIEHYRNQIEGEQNGDSEAEDA